MLEASSKPDTEQLLHQRLVADHMGASMTRGRMYSCPANMLSLVSLGGYLDEPATKRARRGYGADGEATLAPDAADMLDDAAGCKAEQSSEHNLYFKIIFANASKKRLCPSQLALAVV